MRITEAARRLDTSPRMLRYRDLLGLLPPVREPASARHHAGGRPPPRGTGLGRQTAPGDAPHPASAGASHPATAGASHPAMPTASRPAPAHRRFGEEDLAAVSLALGIEQRYDISPAALAFGLRVLTEPGVRADVAELARRIGRIGPLPARALEFEKERALRLLSLAPGRWAERPARPDGQRTRAASRPAR
jgi:MerR family transcriptional regulator, copper efflux regulator